MTTSHDERIPLAYEASPTDPWPRVARGVLRVLVVLAWLGVAMHALMIVGWVWTILNGGDGTPLSSVGFAMTLGELLLLVSFVLYGTGGLLLLRHASAGRPMVFWGAVLHAAALFFGPLAVNLALVWQGVSAMGTPQRWLSVLGGALDDLLAPALLLYLITRPAVKAVLERI